MVETFFTEKTIIKKVIIVLLFIFMFNFTFSHLGSNIVLAQEETSGSAELTENYEDKELEDGGGKLLLPIHDLILWIADSLLEILQISFYSPESIIQKAKSKDMSEGDTGALVLCVVAVVICTVAVVYTAGAAAGAVPAIMGAANAATGGAAVVAGLTAAAGVAKGICGGLVIAGVSGFIAFKEGDAWIKSIKGEYDLPMIMYTPERIFSNDIPLFNINFFNPADKIIIFANKAGSANVDESILADINYARKMPNNDTDEEGTQEVWKKFIKTLQLSNFELVKKGEELTGEFVRAETGMVSEEKFGLYSYSWDMGWGGGSLAAHNKAVAEQENPESLYNTTKHLRMVPEEEDDIQSISFWVYQDYIYMLQSYAYNNIYGGYLHRYHLHYNGDVEKRSNVAVYDSSSAVLQNIVASMYKTLRTLAIVALLSILVYVGIRMVISSTSKDKARYKQMLLDWLLALVLVFVLHYIMAFIVDIAEKLTDICDKSNIENIQFEIPGNTFLYNKASKEFETAPGYNTEGKSLKWGSNFIGYIRFYAGLVQQKGYTLKGVSYTIMYIVLVIYIIIFTFQYLRRVLYMAFLTMISPLVAITYPLDKINDGKAQGFNMWLKEYIFNALLQPIHYIIYVIIMGSVMEMVVDHPVYALVALGFMTPAEKFIRKMFGFEKAATVSAFGGAAGAAMLMNGVQKLTGGASSKKDKSDNTAQGTQNNPNGKIKTINPFESYKKGGNSPNVATKTNPALTAANAGKKAANTAGNITKNALPGLGEQKREHNSLGIRMANIGDSENMPNSNIVDNSDFEKFGMGHNVNQSIARGALKEEDFSESQREALNFYRDHVSDEVAETGYSADHMVSSDDFARFGSGYNINERIKAGELSEESLTDQQKGELDYWKSKNGYGSVELSGGEIMSPQTTPISISRPEELVTTLATSTQPTAEAPVTTLATSTQPTPRSRTYEQYNISNRARGSLGQGLQAVGGFYVRKLNNNMKKVKPLKTMRRFLTSAIGAATLGAVGLAAGIASGDPSKAFQYTTAGALAGKNLGRNLGDKVSDTLDLEDAGKAFRAGTLGNANQQMEREKYKRDFKMNNTNYLNGVSRVGASGWRDMSKKGGVIDTALDYGINNLDDMSTIYRVQQGFKQEEYNKRGISNPDDLSKDERDAIEKKSMQDAFAMYEFKKNYGNFEEDERQDKNLTHTLKNMGHDDAEIKKIKEGLKEKLEIYNNAELGQGDYSEDPIRMQNQGYNPTDNPSIPSYDPQTQTNGSQSTDKSSDDDQNQGESTPLTEVSIGAEPKEDPWARADAARAESDRAKNERDAKAEAARRQAETDGLKAQISEKRAQTRQATEKRRQSEQKIRERKEKIEAKNSVTNGEQGESVADQRKTKRRGEFEPKKINVIAKSTGEELNVRQKNPPIAPNTPLSRGGVERTSNPPTSGNNPNQ